jgi:hypothetical protein
MTDCGHDRLRDLPTVDLARTYDDRRLDRLADDELVAAVVAIVAEPREGPADSFVLHAPLELTARARHLAALPTDDEPLRRLARLRLVSIAARYLQHPPAPIGPPDTAAEDPDRTVDRLAPAIAARTAAAAHGPILLATLTEVPDRAPGWLPLLRPLTRELDRHPDWRLRWFERATADPTDHRPPGDPDPTALFAAVADPPRLGIPGSTFIHPLLMQVDAPGVADEVLGPVAGPRHASSTEAARALTRVAALAMVRDTPDHAPYGWTHCLTLPQAILTLAPRLVRARVPALSIAATHVLGIRAALATTVLDATDELLRPADPATIDRRRRHLTAEAARRHDAHVAKYLLAVLTEAERDPEASELHLTAGEHLLAVWDATGPDPDDLLADEVATV